MIAVKDQRLDPESFTQLYVESGCDLIGFTTQPKLNITVIDKEIGPHQLLQLGSIQVVAHVRESQSGGDTDGAQTGGK